MRERPTSSEGSLSQCGAYQGFTLVEILVVIAIVAVLAALLLPVLGSMKARGQSTQCAGNLRQIGAAFQLWAADNDGLVQTRDHSDWINGPDGSYPLSWVSNLNRYLMSGRTYDGKVENTASIFRCPAGKNQEWNGTSYVANIYLGGFRDPKNNVRMGVSAQLYNPKRVVACLAPSKCVIVVDGNCKDQGFLEFDAGGPQSSPPMALRHNKTVNALFADGHTENLNPLTMSATEYQEKFRWNYGGLWPATQ